MLKTGARHLLAVVMCATALAWPQMPVSAQTAPRPSVFQTTLEEPGQLTPEITTEELLAILATGSEPVFDVRFAKEYAIAHIPGTINIFEKEVERIAELYPDRNTPMVLLQRSVVRQEQAHVGVARRARLHACAAVPARYAGVARAQSDCADRHARRRLHFPRRPHRRLGGCAYAGGVHGGIGTRRGQHSERRGDRGQ